VTGAFRGAAAGGRTAGLSRRGFCRSLLAGAGLGAAGAALAPAAASGAGALDLADERDLLRAYVKMRMDLEPEMTIGWLRAKRFAVSRGRVEPVCGMLSATFSRQHRVTDTLFEFVVLEITHYTDFDTGALLETVVMPFSGQEVEVPAYRVGPATTRFAVRLAEREEYAPTPETTEQAFAPAGEVLMTKSLEPGYVRDGDLFLRHEEHGRVYPADSELPSMFYRESTIWSAPVDQVRDGTRSRVDARVSYSAMTSWRPWMQMGDLPGHTASNGFGRRAASVADLPEDFLAYTRQRHPDVVADPEAILDAFEG